MGRFGILSTYFFKKRLLRKEYDSEGLPSPFITLVGEGFSRNGD